jgi:hypothetical protein
MTDGGAGRAEEQEKMKRGEAFSPTEWRVQLGLIHFAFLLLVFLPLVSLPPAAAQFPPVKTAPLQPPVPQGEPGCAVTGPSSCEKAAAKILPLVMGPSPLEGNLRGFMEGVGERPSSPSQMAQAVAWAVGAFRAAGVEVHTEKYTIPVKMPDRASRPVEQENVVGEIRGSEKPDEMVILGARLDLGESRTKALDSGCDAALVIEAARAIKSSGLLPRRSIRFVLFSEEAQGTLGSWAYVKQHEAELNSVRAMVAFDKGVGHMTGYSLGGRRDIETGVREAIKPLDSWGATHDTYDAFYGTDNFDFLLQGVPTLVANQSERDSAANPRPVSGGRLGKVDIGELKRQTALAAVTAWGIADRSEPIGKRLTRAEMEPLLKETGLEEQMKRFGLWPSWEDGTRGRKP